MQWKDSNFVIFKHAALHWQVNSSDLCFLSGCLNVSATPLCEWDNVFPVFCHVSRSSGLADRLVSLAYCYTLHVTIGQTEVLSFTPDLSSTCGLILCEMSRCVYISDVILVELTCDIISVNSNYSWNMFFSYHFYLLLTLTYVQVFIYMTSLFCVRCSVPKNGVKLNDSKLTSFSDWVGSGSTS